MLQGLDQQREQAVQDMNLPRGPSAPPRGTRRSAATMSNHRTLTVIGVLAQVLSICALRISAAHAQSASVVAPSETEEARAGEIPEIVVTAERREEQAQSVPIAVSVISSEAALKSGITTSEELVLAVPGLQMDLNGGGLSPFLRGVGTTFADAGAEPSVAIYMDGVYIPSPEGGLFNLNNVERVEILKGPQGTLFGRNATGGVIQGIPKDPSNEPS